MTLSLLPCEKRHQVRVRKVRQEGRRQQQQQQKGQGSSRSGGTSDGRRTDRGTRREEEGKGRRGRAVCKASLGHPSDMHSEPGVQGVFDAHPPHGFPCHAHVAQCRRGQHGWHGTRRPRIQTYSPFLFLQDTWSRRWSTAIPPPSSRASQCGLVLPSPPRSPTRWCAAKKKKKKRGARFV